MVVAVGTTIAGRPPPGITVVAVARQKDDDFLRKLGANVIAHSDGPDVVRELPQVDAILDLVGGETLQRAVTALKQRGKLISVVSQQSLPNRKDVDPMFFYADVTTARLRALMRCLSGAHTKCSPARRMTEERLCCVSGGVERILAVDLLRGSSPLIRFAYQLGDLFPKYR